MSKKDTTVLMAYHDAMYEDAHEYVKLGRVTKADACAIIDAIHKHIHHMDSCIRGMRATFKAETSFGYALGNEYRTSLNLENVSYHHNNKLLPCMCVGMDAPYTKAEIVKKCADNIRNGKCRDKFMRDAVGTILYPEIYANQKTKGK